jgi:hypothetical protein
MEAKAYEIRDDETGQKVERCRPEDVDFALMLWNSRRELDVDGKPLGLYVAVPCNPGAGWGL